MIERNKLQELKQRIAEKEKEITGLREQRANSEKPEEMVILDKKIAEVSGVLAALERTWNAITYKPPAPTKKQVLLSGMDAYLQSKKEKVQEAVGAVRQVEKELQTVTFQLEAATETGNVDKVVEYAEKQEGLHKRLKYVQQMKTATENKAPFSSDEVLGEWAKICQDKKPEFDLLLFRIELLAEEYRNACDELMGMNDTLLEVRREMWKIASENGVNVSFRPVLTVGVNVEPLKISKVDGMKPGFIMNGFNGKAL